MKLYLLKICLTYADRWKTFHFKTDPSNKMALMSTGKLLTISHIDDLAWLIPAVIAGVVFLVIFAVLCFYGIRRFELKLIACCFNTCGCCGPPDDEAVPLTGSFAGNSTELKGRRLMRNVGQEHRAYVRRKGRHI